MQQLNKGKPLPVRSTPTRAVIGQQAGASVQSHYTRSQAEKQCLNANLPAQALRQADRAGLLWEACKEVDDPSGAAFWRRQFQYQAISWELGGDHDGFWFWKRRALKHQAVAWAALHPHDTPGLGYGP